MNAFRRYPLALYFSLTVLLSFACYLLPIPRGEAVQFALVLVPTLVSVVVVGFTEGGAAARSLLRLAFQWRVSLKWLAIALALALAMRLAVSLAAIGLGILPALKIRPVTPAQVAILGVILLIAALLEEIGWRGYALTRLLKTRSPLAASLVIGVFWGLIHLVLHLPGMALEGLSIIPTLIQLISLSVLATWIYLGSSSRVVLPAVFHASQSFLVIFNDGISLSQQGWLMAAAWGAAALLVVLGSHRMQGFSTAGRSAYRMSVREP